MTVPGLPQGTVPGPSVAPPKTGTSTTGARRSLLDQDAHAAAGLSTFRRLDLTAQDPAIIGRGGLDGRDQTRASPGRRARDDQSGPDVRTAATAADPAAAQESRRSGLRGLLGALATGRTSLLSGALGFLAQVLGQRAGPVAQSSTSGDTVPTETTVGDPAGQAAGVSEALSKVATNPDQPGAGRSQSQLETRNGVRAYDLVNRLVGSPNDIQGGRGVEFTLPLPFGHASTSVDQVA